MSCLLSLFEREIIRWRFKMKRFLQNDSIVPELEKECNRILWYFVDGCL
uniref:Uncharacterized protein n=1 Tax=mine drainage metagenome TaxID=410659 RepID=E6QRE6_9ZZZZ